jgi:hypothetical protein
MAGDEWVLVSDETFAGFWYFFLFPPILSQRRGEAQSRGESKIRDELSFQASGKPMGQKNRLRIAWKLSE